MYSRALPYTSKDEVGDRNTQRTVGAEKKNHNGGGGQDMRSRNGHRTMALRQGARQSARMVYSVGDGSGTHSIVSHGSKSTMAMAVVSTAKSVQDLLCRRNGGVTRGLAK